jgi:signal transduction histidine kinase/CheY-like chemotaxis protein
VIALLLSASVGFALPGVYAASVKGSHPNSTIAKYYKNIPGITKEQVDAVSSIFGGRTHFTYGMLESSECFYREDGTIGGYAALVCNLFSELFGVSVEPRILDWDELESGIRSGEIDFSGDYTPVNQPAKGLIKSDTIAERAIMTARLTSGIPIEYLAKQGKIRYGFLKDSAANTLVNDRLEKTADYEYTATTMDTVDEAVAALRDGSIDAFVADGTLIEPISTFEDITAESFSPLTYKLISITTANENLVPIIDVIELYLKSNGGLSVLNSLYVEGYNDFCYTDFLRSLSEEERIWYDEHIAVNKAITVAVANASYPINFYNENEEAWDGVAVDIMEEITRITGLEFNIVNGIDTPWPEALAMFERGDAQMIAELLKTDSRLDSFNWGNRPYASDKYVLISTADYEDISTNQILYSRIGLVKDTGYAYMFKEWFQNYSDITEYDSIYDAYDALDDGDIDLIMATENRLLAVTNYMERSGYKINLTFDYSAESYFGFNLNEPELPGIISKAQAHVDTASIANRWTHMTFDYQSKIAESRFTYLIFISVLLFALFILAVLIILRRRKERTHLETLVAVRTHELEEQTKATEAASNAKSDFLANMSHEMRTPLNAVIGLSELTLTQDYSMEDAQSNIEKVYNSGLTLLGIVNDILDLSKIESGKFELVPAEYDIPSLINDAVTLNIIRIGSKPIEFVLDIESDLPARLIGDELRVKQVFNNILSNAFKYTQQGHVKWSVRCETDPEDEKTIWLISEVRDTGIGIKPENLPKIFGEYNQIDTLANRKIEGTGLGLPITKRMVEMMDGDIRIESKYEEGSTFTVRMKQEWATDEQIGEEVVSNLLIFKYSDHRRDRNASLIRSYIPYARVLVVDDVITNLDVAKGIFKPYGMRVDTVTSGKAAIKLIEKGEPKFSAIFMDHMMPEMDGIEATKIIRGLDSEYAKSIPIIALTANAIIGNDKMFLDNGFDDFLSKPIDILKLDVAVNRWVRDKAMERSLKAKGEKYSASDADGERAELQASERPVWSAVTGTMFEGKVAHGINFEDGLALFGGDESIYADVMKSFAINTPDLLTKVAVVTPETLGDYAIIVHGLKSASRNVGATDLSYMAAWLETVAKEGDFDSVAAQNDAFIMDVQAVIAGINNLLIGFSSVNPKETKPAPSTEVLRSVRDAAKEFDIDGIDAGVELLDTYQYETGGELVDWIKEQVKMMRFEQIAERLSDSEGMG